MPTEYESTTLDLAVCLFLTQTQEVVHILTYTEEARGGEALINLLGECSSWQWGLGCWVLCLLWPAAPLHMDSTCVDKQNSDLCFQGAVWERVTS